VGVIVLDEGGHVVAVAVEDVGFAHLEAVDEAEEEGGEAEAGLGVAGDAAAGGGKVELPGSDLAEDFVVGAAAEFAAEFDEVGASDPGKGGDILLLADGGLEAVVAVAEGGDAGGGDDGEVARGDAAEAELGDDVAAEAGGGGDGAAGGEGEAHVEDEVGGEGVGIGEEVGILEAVGGVGALGVGDGVGVVTCIGDGVFVDDAAVVEAVVVGKDVIDADGVVIAFKALGAIAGEVLGAGDVDGGFVGTGPEVD
jgi:hypothetical protein